MIPEKPLSLQRGIRVAANCVLFTLLQLQDQLNSSLRARRLSGKFNCTHRTDLNTVKPDRGMYGQARCFLDLDTQLVFRKEKAGRPQVVKDAEKQS